MNIRKYRIGMRTIKTGLAVSISVMIAELVGLSSPLFVGIGAISTMQASVSESFAMGKNRILGTIMGALVALVMSYLFPSNILFLALGIIIVIHFLNLLGWKKSINLSAIVFLAVFLNHEEAMIPYATNRVLDTFIGIVVGMLINYFIAAPNNDTVFYKLATPFIDEVKCLTYDVVIGKKKMDLSVLKDNLSELVKVQDLIEDETKLKVLNKKNITTTRSLLSILLEMDNDISALTMMNYVATITPANLSGLEELFKINTFWEERAVLNQDDIIFNYHLQRILSNLDKCKDKMASL